MLTPRIWLLGGLLFGVVSVVMADSGFLPNLNPFQDPTGKVETFQYHWENRSHRSVFPEPRNERA
jgi:hypothetical protein